MATNVDSLLYGYDLFGDPVSAKASGPVAEKFLFPPFSVLDARSGEWQDRKRAWTSIGLIGEIGRKDELTYTGAARSFDYYRVKEGTRGSTDEQGTSIFDPVLCELIYRWFCPKEGQVIDPFSGGSVRGIIAGAVGLKYWGCDLSKDQIAANEQQADDIVTEIRPIWVCGDSNETLRDAPYGDLLFSCPPYGDLEKYSDNPSDLSAMTWENFMTAYRMIVSRACSKLRPDRFACFVVGDFRDNRGNYRNFVSETIGCFLDAGLQLYNEGILITSVGSASMRVSKQFDSGRKFAKTHQNVLVFCKGDWKNAVKHLRKVD